MSTKTQISSEKTTAGGPASFSVEVLAAQFCGCDSGAVSGFDSG
jgi:hypothetical protein